MNLSYFHDMKYPGYFITVDNIILSDKNMARQLHMNMWDYDNLVEQHNAKQIYEYDFVFDFYHYFNTEDKIVSFIVVLKLTR